MRIRLRTKQYLIYNETTMKNKFLLVPIVSLTFVVLTGCTHKKVNLTFGTYIEQSLDSLKHLETSEMFDKAYSEETYILATYQEKYSNECLCWNTFQNVIVNYMNKYHEKVSIYNMDNYGDLQMDLGIEEYNDSTPALYIYQGQKQLAKFTYKNNKDKSIFNDLEAGAMYERIHKFVNKPSIYEVDDSFLENGLTEPREVIALFIRTGCGDCHYSLSNVIIPYTNQIELKKEIWCFDLQDYYLLQNKEDATEEEKNQYQNFKHKYGLSEFGNKKYGYGDGFVPTIQYYRYGVLKDASVFFNDEIAQKEDGSYFISKSFYSSDRLTSLSYCKDVETNVLEGMVLNENEIVKTSYGYTYWSQEKAAVYHTPLLEAFLDYYCK